MSRISRTFKALLRPAYARLFRHSPKKLVGALDIKPGTLVIRGWAALRGDPNPRDIIVRISNRTFRKRASIFRPDVLKAGINAGNHGFELTVPWPMQGGQKHRVQLIDKETNMLLAEQVAEWRGVPSYRDFNGFLASSMTQPVFSAPFDETTKQCFALMENIADHLAGIALNLKNPPLVSVIMPTFNRAHLIERSVRAAQAQSYKNFELLVVDDGSTDDTAAKFATLTDERIRYMPQTENRGQAAARNIAIAAARGDIIAYLDSDDTWDPRYLAATVGAFAENPEAAAVYSGTYIHYNGEDLPRIFLYGHFHRALLESKNYVPVISFAHRAGLKIAGGFFDTSLVHQEDADLLLRLTDDHMICSIPVALSHYLMNDAEHSVTKKKSERPPIVITHERLEARRELRFAKALAKRPRPKRKVTAIIPNWNALPELRRCLRSLNDQRWGNKLDILVVDNASDTSVRTFLQQEEREGRLRVIQNNANLGFSFAVNQGIEASDPKSDLLLLNNDAVLRGPALTALQEAALALPQAGIVAPRQILPAHEPTISAHVPYADFGYEADTTISAHHQNLAPLPLFQCSGLVELTFAAFFAVYIKRAVVDAIGLLDAEHGRHYRSDRIYCEKMRLLTGYKVYYAPEAHFEHRVQVATNALRRDPDKQAEFAYMFQQNRWEPELAERYGFRRKVWDLK